MVIVLTIVKIILILLAVVVCILATVLFLPVNYEADLDIDEKRADIRVNWLLRIVRFRFHAGKPMKAVLSILFFKVDFTDPEAKRKRAEKRAKRERKKAAKTRRKREKKRRGGKEHKKEKEPPKKVTQEALEADAATDFLKNDDTGISSGGVSVQKQVSDVSGNGGTNAENIGDVDGKIGVATGNDSADGEKIFPTMEEGNHIGGKVGATTEKGGAGAGEAFHVVGNDDNVGRKTGTTNGEDSSTGGSASDAVRKDNDADGKFGAAAKKISATAGKVSDAAEKIGEVTGKVSGAGKTVKRIIGLLQKYEVFEIAWPKLARFLNRIRPRVLTGCVAFGMEDPATTGKLVGALAMVPFLYQTDLRINPDFETDETYVKGKILLKGHLRLIAVVILAIGLIKEKNLRQFVSDIRNGREA